MAAKNAYSTPLTTLTVKATGFAPSVIVPRTLLPERVGNIACRPVAAGLALTVKLSVFRLPLMLPNDEEFRPSSQVSIWRLVTIGTPRATAELTTASAAADEAASVCALMV